MWCRRTASLSENCSKASLPRLEHHRRGGDGCPGLARVPNELANRLFEERLAAELQAERTQFAIVDPMTRLRLSPADGTRALGQPAGDLDNVELGDIAVVAVERLAGDVLCRKQKLDRSGNIGGKGGGGGKGGKGKKNTKKKGGGKKKK